MVSLSTDRNVLRLAAAQAMSGANTTVVYATGAIIGHRLAPDPAMATLPISIFVAGMAISTLPAGALAKRHGRRAAFLVGNASGVIVGLLAALAILQHAFWLYCFAMVFGGIYAAITLTFRFAAAECVAAPDRAKALSRVMAGGVIAGVLGPQLVNLTMDAWPPHTYVLTYIGSALVAVISALVLRGVRFRPIPAAQQGPARPLPEILRQPRLIAAMLCGAVSYTLMNFMMTSAPLAMDICGLPASATNTGLQWHVIAMYGPSFFTGNLIARFGASRLVMAGLALIACAAGVGLSGIDVMHFWAALILLGLGWNFSFLGASALVLECHLPSERTRVQSINDFVVFGCMVVGSFSSGSLLTTHGWEAVCLVMLPPVAIAVLVALRLGPRPRHSLDSV